MYCPNCGSFIQDGGRFCPTCGTPVSATGQAQHESGYAQQPAQDAYPYQQQSSAYSYEQPSQDDAGYQQPYAQQQYAQPDPFLYQQMGQAQPPEGMALRQAQGQPMVPPAGVRHMDTDRSLLLLVLLTMVTCGIYYYVFIYNVAQDMNDMCQDNDTTGGLVAFILLSVVTCGLYSLYWEYKVANRLQRNAPVYGLTFTENGTSVLLWRLLGALLCVVGSYYGMYLWINNLNQLSAAYNRTYGV